MSYLVLHMDKFKRESLRGIQSHNRRERRSHSNPDIRHEKSRENYELHQTEVSDYVRAVQARIESLNLPKAVRKDAVVLCGLIVTSDLPFFARLPPEEQRRFFEESRDFLTRFVRCENVISALIHMDEKGKLEAVGKPRGKKKALEALLASMEKGWQPEISRQVIIGHGDSPEVAKELRSMVAARFPEADIFIAPIGPVIGAHAGPGVMTVFFWGNNR